MRYSILPLLLVGCSIEVSLEELSSSVGTSLAWDQNALQKSGDLQAKWEAPTNAKVVQQELLYYKGANCEDPILPTIQLGADAADNTASFSKDEGEQYTFRVFSMDVTGKVKESDCSAPVTYQDSFAVATSAVGGKINEANVATAPFYGRCAQGASVQVSAPSAANITTFTCSSSGNWSRTIDLSAMAGVYAGDITFTVTPQGGGTPKSYTVTVDKDSVAPTIDIPSIAAINAANQGAYTVSGTCSENGQTVNIAIGTINTTATCSTGTFSKTLDVTSLTGNTISVSATHKDTFDNTRSKFVITSRYVAVPTITSVALNAGAAYTNSLTATLNMNVTGATHMYITNTAGCASGGAWETYATSKSWTLPLANSTNTVYVKFKESHDNETACVSDDIIHDNSNPIIAITSPIAGSYVNGANLTAFTISGSCTENGRSITITGPSSFTSTTTCSGTSFSAILDLTSLAQGSFQLGASINDAAGNTGSAISPSYTKDTVVPTGSVSINGGAASTTSLTATLTLTSSDAGGQMYVTNTSGCASGGAWEAFAASKSWSLATADATNTVYSKFKDAAGNESSCYSDTIVHTSTTPTVTIASPASGSYINIANSTAFTISGACSENGQPVDITVTGLTVTSPTCSAGAWTKTLDVSSLADASISFTVNHSSSGGIAATAASQSYTKDTVAPTVTTFIIKNDDAYTNQIGNTLTIAAATSTEMYITNNALCLTGGTWETYATSQVWWLATADAYNTVYFKTRDIAGNESNCVSDSITHDGSVANVAWVSPASMAYINIANNAAFDVSGTCSIDGRPVSVAVYNGATYQNITNTPTCTSGTWNTTFDLSAKADATYTLRATHTSLGGSTVTQNRSFVKDTVAPGAATLSGAPTGTNTTSTLNITVSGTGLTQYKYFVVPPSSSEVCTNLAAYTGSAIALATKITDTLTEQGAYKVCVLGREASGNDSTSTTSASWTRDTVGPIPQSVTSSTADGSYGLNSIINVDVTFNEPVSVTGTPRILMETGGTTRYATLWSGQGTSTLTFRYTVATGDNSADLDYAAAAVISLNGGALKDTLGNNATLTLPAAGSANSLAGQKSISVNAPAPVAVLTGYPTGTYTGSTINVTVSGTGLVQYKYNVISTGTCATTSYTSAIAISTPISTTVFTHPNGPVTLCVIGSDASGTWQPVTSATSVTWIKDAINTLSITSARMNRVTEGSGTQTVTITMNATKTYDVLVNYRASGDASYPSQHDLVNGSVTIPAGSTAANVTINFPDNAATTGEKVLNFIISHTDNPSMAYATSINTAQFYIVDDEKNLTVTKASIGRKHNCAIMSDNSLRCWGHNTYGQIGDASTTFRSEAVIISAGTSFKDVAVGNEHTCAIASNGDLYCWGRNANGQVGNNGAGVDKNSPQLIDSGVAYKAVSSGENHSCGLTTGNKVRCWGQGMYGALGQGGTGNLNVPTEIDAAVSYKFVSVGAKSSCAITTADKLRCWGHNAVNQLGDGTTTNATSPIDVDATYDFATVSIGSGHACGVTTTGLMRCWGYNGTGAIGDGTTTARTTPVSVNASATYTAVSVNDDVNVGGGRTTTCALLSSGAAQCWGSNANALLANGTLTQSTSPVNVDAGTTYSNIAVTGSRACGITSGSAGGALKCWGNFTYDSTKTLNLWGAGYAPHMGSWNKWFTNLELPQWDIYTPANNSVFDNASQACGLKSGKLFCWGASAVFGDGSRSAVRRYAPVAIDPATTYTAIATQHDADNCAIDNAGNLLCWGKNDYGELGAAVAVGSTAYVPTNVDPGTTYKAVSVNYATICAITTANTLRCAGRNQGGQAGDGTTNAITSFTTIDSGVTYAEIVRGYFHTCGRTMAGTIKCWGANGFGSVGNGGTTSELTPYTIDSGAIYKKLIVGANASCGITATDTVKCWGDSMAGTGASYTYSPTVIDGGATYTAVSMGYSNACGIKTDGTMKCWGYSDISNLTSVGETNSHGVFNVPIQVAGGATFSKVQVNYSSICGTTTGGTMMCSGASVGGEWGYADAGLDTVISTTNTQYFLPSFINRALNF